MSAVPILFSDELCPFARRASLMLDYLGVTYESRVVPCGQKPAGLAEFSTSERIPLLAHDGLALTESRVILEYVAGRFGLRTPRADFRTRVLHAHAMAVADDFLAPLLFTGLPTTCLPRLEDTLDIIEAATTLAPPTPNLLAFHLAPLWWFLTQVLPAGELLIVVQRRPQLVAWLQDANVVTTSAAGRIGCSKAF